MIFAEVKVSGVCAHTTRKRLIPAGIVGAKVSFSFTDPKWDNLTKTVVFKGFVTKDVLLEGNTVRIPQEVVSRKDVRLLVGVYGTDAENNIAIPTLWADLGTVRNAADPSGDESTDPSIPVWAQLQNQIDDLRENGLPSGGGPGENGGYYTPSVKQPDNDTLQFDFTPSKADMPAIEPVQVDLPAGPQGDDYTLTDADKKEIAQMAADLVDVPDSGGNVDKIHSLNDGDRHTVRAMVSFIDDDCRSEAYSKLFPAIYDDENKVLKFPYALACPPASIGGSGYMAQTDLLKMYNAGVNIVCHHCNQYNMDQFATADAYDADLTEALEMFKKMGISDVCSVAYPQGQYLEDYIRIVKKHFKMGFTVERGINQIPYESFYMKRCELFPTDGSFTLDKAKELVDQLAVDGGWLIFMTHAWYEDTFDTGKLLELAEYIQGTKKIPIVGVDDAIKATGNVIDIGHFRKPLEERTEPFVVVDASGKMWTNAMNIYDRSGKKITAIKPQYHTESYLTPSGNVRFAEDSPRIASDLVEVKPGETYLLTCSSLYALAAYVIYKSDGTVESHVVSNTDAAIEGDTVLTNFEKVMPENATGLRVMAYLTNQPNGFEIKKVETVERSDDVTPYVRKEELPTVINTALEQAKASGEFDGPPGEPGKDYVLTTEDKKEIAELVEVPQPSGGGIAVTGAKVGQTVKIAEVDENGVPTAWESVDFPSGGSGGDVWEKITDITLTEDTTKVSITQGADGNAFSLKKVYMMFVPAYGADNKTSGVFRVYSEAGVIGASLSGTRTQSVLLYIDEVQAIESVHYDGTTGMFDTYAIKTHQISRSKEGTPISKFEMAYTNVTYYSGTKITVWGVRA